MPTRHCNATQRKSRSHKRSPERYIGLNKLTVNAQQPNSIPCKIAFLGEAPGDEEVNAGVPFVGPSGRIFNAMLRTAGIDRKECWVGNVFTEKLPDNDVANWCADTKTARAEGFADLPPIGSAGYLKPEHLHHLDGLEAQLSEVKPTVVVPLGGTALWALAGMTTIMQNRGAVQPARYVWKGKLIPTFHPAYVMRAWKYYAVVVGDIMKAGTEAEKGPEIEYPKRELLLAPSIKEVESFRDSLLGSFAPELLSVDIETGWGLITCIGFAPNTTSAICIPFVDLRKTAKSYWGCVDKEIRAWKVVKSILESNVPKLGQNYASYDAFWLLAKIGIKTMNLRHDTRLLHHALYPELPKDLAFLGASYTQQGPWKTMRPGIRPKRDD